MKYRLIDGSMHNRISCIQLCNFPKLSKPVPDWNVFSINPVAVPDDS